MAKLKKSNLKLLFCPTCKGNGYLKVGTESGETVHQCWDCDSEGEFYETSDTLIGDSNGNDNSNDSVH
jgi:uncharacterized protein YbaR (Trm112 family)